MENSIPLDNNVIESDAVEIEKVKRAFFRNGRLTQSPAKMSKRIIAYRIILDNFDTDRCYSEKEVNQIIGTIYHDYCDVRRFFVEMGWMTRKDGVYRRTLLTGSNTFDID